MLTLSSYRFSSVVIGCLLMTSLVYGTPQSGETAVRSRSLTVLVSDQGEVTRIQLGGRGVTRMVSGRTVLQGCSVQGPVARKALAGGGVEFRREWVETSGQHRVMVTERFLPTPTSVRWELELSPGTEPWTTPIETRLRYPSSSAVKFWTTWSDPVQQDKGWRDPLVAMPVRDLKLWYGAPPFYIDPLPGFMPLRGDLFSVPLATFLEPELDLGFSVVLSPRDNILDLGMETTAAGDLAFSRLYHRLSAAQPLKFDMDLIAHEADWRGGLRWMTSAYPDYFNVTNSLADEIAGAGAYSLYEGDLDVEKMRRMAFRVNWKASYDFPYPGMFLPPVDDQRVWNRFSDVPLGVDPDADKAPNGRTSIPQMAEYSRRMRAQGFYVLNYFNVSEFGAEIHDPAPARRFPLDQDLWRDANDFVYAKLKDAILRVPTWISAQELKKLDGSGKTQPGGPYYTWGDGIVLDCGEPAYADFLVEQARRHVEKLPQSSGICIDRMDWVRMYNEERDDGVSWSAGHPTRSLVTSWKGLFPRLTAIMHGAGKVVYCNDHVRRIDLLRDADGIFDEFDYSGPAMNDNAFLTVRRPAVAWTPSENDLKPDPDAYLQRHLYLGFYPMAPYPGNDHSVRPGEWVEKQYCDYGPLLDLMRGKKWVLSPHAVEVGGAAAKANLFQVPEGYVVPVVFGGDHPEVTVTLRGLGPAVVAAEVFHPGSAVAKPLSLVRADNRMVLSVPLERHCAIVRLRTSAKTP